MTISDHSPVELIWGIGHRQTSKQWRLNASLLNDKEFISFVTKELKLYLSLNDSSEVSPLIVWDCAKAYLRGRIISFASAKKRERAAKQQELEYTIKNLEKQHKQTSNPQLLNKIKNARREYNSLIADKIEGNLRFINQRYYEHGNRASRLLAIRLKKAKIFKHRTKDKI